MTGFHPNVTKGVTCYQSYQIELILKKDRCTGVYSTLFLGNLKQFDLFAAKAKQARIGHHKMCFLAEAQGKIVL